jgi:hypothetical protein
MRRTPSAHLYIEVIEVDERRSCCATWLVLRNHVPRGLGESRSNLFASRELQLELPALEYRDHAAELVPGDLATIDDDPWHTMIAIDGAAED